MQTLRHLGDHLAHTLDGPAWHGPALRELLHDVSASQAAAHPVAGVHSIWEIVLHVSAWHRAVSARLRGEPADLDAAADWPAVEDVSEPAWEAAQADLAESAATLRDVLTRLDPAQLDADVVGQSYSQAVMLHGVVGHDLYHAGQIALLKKAAG